MIFLFFSSSLACLEPELELFEVWEINVRQIIIIANGINSQTPKLQRALTWVLDELHYTPSSRSTVKLRLWVLAQDWQLILHVLLLHILVLPSLVSKFVEQRWRFHYWKEPHWSLHILAIRLTNILLHKQREDRKGVHKAVIFVGSKYHVKRLTLGDSGERQEWDNMWRILLISVWCVRDPNIKRLSL